LVGVLALSVLYAFFTTPRLEKAPPRETPRSVTKLPETSAGKDSPADSKGRIDFAFLEQDVQEFPGAERDIFNFGGKRIRVQPKPEVKKPVEAKPTFVETVKVQPPPMDIVNRSLSQFTFVGFLEKAGEKTVFLSSSGEMFLVKSGERFGVDREFLVKEIEGDFIRIKHDAREGIIELKLIEQQKLNSAVSAPARVVPSEAVAPQNKVRFFTPKKRSMNRPETPQGAFPEMNQENNPEAEELPEAEEEPEASEGQGPEGEFNGTNQ
jgi:hypothetical protein